MRKGPVLYGFAFFISLVLVLGGCGNDNMAPVSGTVRWDGHVLSGGRVDFLPVGGGKPAVGVIRPDGAFVLMTEHDCGAVIGAYRVTVSSECVEGNRGKNVLFLGPRDTPIEVAAGQTNDFLIDINPRRGWRIVLDD